MRERPAPAGTGAGQLFRQARCRPEYRDRAGEALDLAPFGKPATLNRVTANRQEDPAVAVLKNGTFVVVWTDWSDTRIDQSPNIRGNVFRVTQ